MGLGWTAFCLREGVDTVLWLDSPPPPQKGLN